MTRIDTMVQRVAQHHGWLENPDYDLTERVKKGLLSNHDRYGYYLCPCRDGDGDRESDKDIICPCSYAQADID